MSAERLACKVFSATTSRDREALGERVTDWIGREKIEPESCVVLQSSDDAFHCISIVVFYSLDKT